MDIIALKKTITAQYFDFQSLKAAIVGHVNERRFIGQLIKRGYIVRVKKGLYIWGDQLDSGGFSKEILANLVYGPSYISLESALAFYGLIPERVETVTSVTFKKNKIFDTPVGSFAYVHLYKRAYTKGVHLHMINLRERYLIADPEKALLDYIALRVRRIDAHTSFSQLLSTDIRIDHNQFARLSTDLLVQYGAFYRSRAVREFTRKVRHG
ncbi:type IV toxin-antitoxin system AbiEi family antitoxin domain-containing protein [Desulfobacterota bacterium M19]